MSFDRSLVDRVRAALSDPRRVAERLGLKPKDGGASYVLVACPTGHEKHPSCSLHKRGSSLGARCHSCGWTGDVLTLIATLEDLDLGKAFPSVLARACELAGMVSEADELRGGKPAERRPESAPRPVASEPGTVIDYPPIAEVCELWSTAGSVADDTEASGALVARRLDPVRVAELDFARALHPDTHPTRLPAWAKFRGRLDVSTAWTRTGHRMLVPVYDQAGAMRSVRAWRVNHDERLPKRVPPAGFRASGLVLANARAVSWLRGFATPSRIVVVEGEPDFLVRSVLFPRETIIGIGSGSWNEEFAARVPYGSEVVLMTHLDPAGDRYALAVTKSVVSRARVYRWTLVTVEDEERTVAA